MAAKRFVYEVALEQDGTATAEGGAPVPPDTTWTPEHLLVASLARCTVMSLRFHADRAGVSVDVSAAAKAGVTRPEDESRFRVVELTCRLDVTLAPLPADSAVAQLLSQAEHDCFVGASLKASTVYEWCVNGAMREPSGTSAALRTPLRRPGETGPTQDTDGLVCGRCGDVAPAGNTSEWLAWNPADISTDDLADGLVAQILVCPECRVAAHAAEEIGGSG